MPDRPKTTPAQARYLDAWDCYSAHFDERSDNWRPARLIELGALRVLLTDKGIFTDDEYFDAMTKLIEESTSSRVAFLEEQQRCEHEWDEPKDGMSWCMKCYATR